MIRKPKPYKRWTAKEIKVLEENFSTTSPIELRKLFPDLTWKQITSRGYALGLQRTK